MTRAHAPALYNGLKTSWKLVVADLGGIEAAAACTRVGKSVIAEYGAITSERFVPIDVVADAEAIGGRAHVTAALARAIGCELVPVEARGSGDLAVVLSEIGRDAGRLFATAALALADGAVSPSEREDMIRELDALRRVAGEAQAVLRAGR